MDDMTISKLLITEYESLKREQVARIGTRDNLVYAALAAMGLVIAAGLRVGGGSGLLTVLPPAVVVLGWTRVANDVKVTHIAQYVRGELATRLAAIIGEPVFGWEYAHRSDSRRTLRYICHTVADLVLFVAAPLAALMVVWCSSPGVVLIIVSVGEAFLVIGLGAVIIAYSGIFRWPDEVSNP